MTRPADPATYINELDITDTQEKGARFVVETRKECQCELEAEALAAELSKMGLVVWIRERGEGEGQKE